MLTNKEIVFWIKNQLKNGNINVSEIIKYLDMIDSSIAVYVLSQIDENDIWCIENIFTSEAKAKAWMQKLCIENDYDKNDAEKYFEIDEYVVN